MQVESAIASRDMADGSAGQDDCPGQQRVAHEFVRSHEFSFQRWDEYSSCSMAVTAAAVPSSLAMRSARRRVFVPPPPPSVDSMVVRMVSARRFAVSRRSGSGVVAAPSACKRRAQKG
jgi:16S rRNA A1518/A1519 N6-dimethyltransferase RsmA/KsgA/DIM1 with predicted DNA glycosylase/AP lyase activity